MVVVLLEDVVGAGVLLVEYPLREPLVRGVGAGVTRTTTEYVALKSGTLLIRFSVKLTDGDQRKDACGKLRSVELRGLGVLLEIST